MFSSPFNRLPLVLVSAVVLSAPAAAIVYVMPTDEAMVQASPVIVYGEVLSIAPGPVSARPVTDASFRIEEVLKGTVAGSTIVVRQPGGLSPDGTVTRIVGLPMLAQGDRVLLFLEAAEAGAHDTVELGLGMFFEVSVGGRSLLMREPSLAASAIRATDDAEAAERRQAEQPREAGGFRRWVADRAVGIRRRADYFARDLPEGPQMVASAFGLNRSRSGCEEPGVALRWQSPGSVSFVVHGTQPGVSGGGGDQVLSAMAAWNGVTRSAANLTVSATSTAEFSATKDGSSAIGFEDPAEEIRGSYDPNRGGTLAAAISYYDCDAANPPYTAPVTGIKAYALTEVDIVTQDGFHHFLDSSAEKRFEAVIGHHLGHALGLGHSDVYDALMAPTLRDDGNAGADLHTDDRRGARALYATELAQRPSPVAEAPEVWWVKLGLMVTWPNGVAGEPTDPDAYDIVLRPANPNANWGSRVQSAYADDDYVASESTVGVRLNWGGMVQPCRVYKVSVRAANAAGDSAWSPSADATSECSGGGSGGGGGGDGGGGAPPPPADPDPPPPPPPPPPRVAPEAAFNHGATCADGLCRALTGEPVIFEDTSTGGITSRRWDFGYDTTLRWSGSTQAHSWSSPGFYEVSLSVENELGDSSRSQIFLVEASDPAGSCSADEQTLCLMHSRYQVRARWWTADGQSGVASVVRAGTDESGLFWFFSPSNWEVLVKVLNGSAENGHVWVYGASTTDVGYVVSVTDTWTDAMREYRNEPGHVAPAITNADAFPADADLPPRDTSSAQAPARESGSCSSGSDTLCLRDGRFELTVEWWTADGERGQGRTGRPRSVESGLFWYFSPLNWEMLVKVVDGTAMNGHYWLCVASATDVGFDLIVRDSETGVMKTYTKDAGSPAPAVIDLGAFPDKVPPE